MRRRPAAPDWSAVLPAAPLLGAGPGGRLAVLLPLAAPVLVLLGGPLSLAVPAVLAAIPVPAAVPVPVAIPPVPVPLLVVVAAATRTPLQAAASAASLPPVLPPVAVRVSAACGDI